MKLSELKNKIERAITKYGDVPVAALGYEDALSLSKIEDAWNIMDLRIMANSPCLPGVSIEDEVIKEENKAFAVIFYDNRF